MTTSPLLLACSVGTLLLAAPAAAQKSSDALLQRVVVDWTVIGDPGNPNDSNGRGRVNKEYRIGTYEVTNEQYAVLLNWKARIGDPLELFHPLMESDPRGGIDRTGAGTFAVPYRYVPKVDMANKPVIYVSCFDAMRFANWMNNGQGDADTEDGTYTLVGGTPIPSNGDDVGRNAGWEIALPTENQWYKAAYYDPSSGVYHLFATGSSALPGTADASPVGDVTNPGPNVVNYFQGADWNSLDGNLVTVGSAGNRTPYGVADMNGNVFEWSHSIFVWQGSPYRISRGGSWFLDEAIMQKTNFGIVKPWVENDSGGIRLVAKAR